ncbi:murein biosynthesis integral membrane protein MurJ [soil metagenome]
MAEPEVTSATLKAEATVAADGLGPASAAAVAPAPKRASVLRSSAIYSGLTMVSRVLGLARDLVLSNVMGASATIAADAYNTAFAFPNLFRRIFAEGAFATAFVPAYAKALERDGEASADELATDAMATLLFGALVLTFVCELLMPWLMYLIAPGFASNPQKFKLAVVLTQIMMPYLPLMAIFAHLSGVLQARGKFIATAAAFSLLNLCTLVTVLPTHGAVNASYAASAGVVLAGVAQSGLVWWGLRRSGVTIRFRLPRLTPQIKALLKLAVPGTIAASATQINLFVSGILASQVQGARTWLAYADRLYWLPLSLVGVAIGVALLPQLSRAVHSGREDEAQGAMDQAVVLSLALSLPAAAALMAMPFYLIDGLWRRGAFTLVDSHATAAVLFHYGWAVPAFVLRQVLQPAFFARQDTRSPMRFSLVSVGVNLALGIVLFMWIGVPGIAAATAVAAWVNVAQMANALWRRNIYRPTPQAVARLARILAAVVALGAMLWAADHFRPFIERPLGAFHLLGLHAKEITVLAVTGAAVLVYPALLFAFGGVTPAELRSLVRRQPKAPGAPAAPAMD